MDPTLSTAGAHKLFGELYRKPRPAEAQAKIDKVVSETQDVFARIRRIEEIDEGLAAAARKSVETAGTPRRGSAGGGRRQAPAGGGAGQQKTGGGAPKGGGGATGRKKPQKEKGPGFFASIFGNQISRWGAKTGVFDSGILSFNYKLSDEVHRLFRLDETTIISAVKGMRFALQRGWTIWEPVKYNTLMTAFQFFNEFIKVDALLRTKENPDVWITETIKLQRFYALLIQFPDYRKFLMEELPKMVAESRGEASANAPALEKVGTYIARLDDRKPSFKNSIAAFYTLARKSVIPWEDIVHELRVKKPVTDSYRAPEAIMTAIHQKIKSLKNQIREKSQTLKDIEETRNRYFTFDNQGKLSTDFLNEVVVNVVRRLYSETAVNDSVLKSHKLEPHRLLFVILRDLDFSAVPLFSGAVTTLHENAHEDVIIFKQGLFKKHIDNLSMLSREMETLVKGNSQFHYNFNQFAEDRKKDRSDPPVGTFLENVKQSMRAFRMLLRDLETIVMNDEMAKGHGTKDDKMNRTKVLPIETISVAARFIPYGEREIAASSRFTGKTIREALQNLVRCLYNYLYIFRDEEFLKKMAGQNTLNEEIRILKEQLAKMGES